MILSPSLFHIPFSSFKCKVQPLYCSSFKICELTFTIVSTKKEKKKKSLKLWILCESVCKMSIRKYVTKKHTPN